MEGYIPEMEQKTMSTQPSETPMADNINSPTFNTVRELYLHTKLQCAEEELASRDALIGEYETALREGLDHIKKGYGTDDVLADLSTKTTSTEVIQMIEQALRRADGKEGV